MSDKVQKALEARKKRKEEEGKTSSSNDKVTAALEARRERISSNIDTIKKDIYSRYEAEAKSFNDTFVDADITWGEDARKTYNDKRANALAVDKLKKDVEAYRKYLGDDVADKLLSATGSMSDNYNAVLARSQWKSEDAYKLDTNGWLNDDGENTAEKVEFRKEKYQSNVDRIAEIEEEINNLPKEYLRGGGVQVHSKYKDKHEALKKERDRLQAENNIYENTQAKTDPHFDVTQLEDFDKTSAKKEDVTHDVDSIYDYMSKIDPSTWKWENGTYVDAFGTPIETDGNSYVHPESGKYSVDDPLGLYLDAVENDTWQPMDIPNGINDAYLTDYNNAMLKGSENDWNQLKPEEIAIYYYYLNTEGKEKALSFLDDMTMTLNRRREGEVQENIANANGFEKFLLNVGSVPANIFGGAVAMADDAINALTGQEYNPYSYGHSMQNSAQVVREETAKDFIEATGGATFLGMNAGDVYQALMSGVDSLAGSVMGGTAYGIFMGASSASSEMKRLYEEGASGTEMIAGGFLAGAAEMFFEKYSIDQFVKMGDTKTKLGILVNFLKQGGVEASEEAFTSIANALTDLAVRGNTSDVIKNIDAYISQGMSQGEATLKALKDVGFDIYKSAMSGFISGGGMGGVASTANYIGYQADVTNQGKEILGENGVPALKALAEKVMGVTDGKLGKEINKLLGKVSATNVEGKNKLSSAIKNLKNANAVGRLSDMVETARISQNTADVVSALENKGLSSKEAKKSAEMIIDSLNKGETKATFKDSRVAEVYNELVGEGESKLKESISERNIQHTATRLGIDIKNRTVDGKSIEKEVDTEGKVAESGKTTRISTGEAVTINKDNAIAKTKIVDGVEKVFFNTDKGVVESTDIQYKNESEALLYESFTDLHPSIASAVIKAYDGKTPVQAYIKGMREGILLYGKHNFQAVGKDISVFSDLAQLSEADQTLALKLGKAVSNIETSKANKALKSAIKTATERAEKDTAEGKKTGKKGKVSFSEGAKVKGQSQKRAVKLARVLANVVGIDIVFYDSMTTTDEELKKSNGGYVDGTIYLDLQHSTNDAHTIAFTMSHELVHFVKEYSPAKFKVFADFLMEEYGKHGVSTSTLLANKMAELKENDPDKAFEEMIADACETMLLDSNVMLKLAKLKQIDLDLFEKIRLHILDILNKIRAEYKSMNYAPTSDEAKALLKMEDVIEQLYEKFEDMVVDATENYQAIQNSNEIVFGKTSVDLGKTESGVKNQLKNHKKIGEDAIAYNGRHRNVHDAILKVGVESMYEMAETMLPYLEEEGILPLDIPGKTIFKNGSYGRTGENTTLCVRTLTYEDFKDRVAEELGRPLTVSESLLVSQKIYDIATEPQCIYCYVAADRKAYDGYLGEYWKAMDKYIKALRKGGDSKALYTEYLAGRKDTSQQQKRWSQWETIAKSGKEYISAKDLTTKRKRDVLIANKNAFSEQIKDAQRYAQSASWAKTVSDYRAYKGDILKMTSKFVDMLNSEYGLRMYSFSDYTPAFIVENMQMIIDASVKGLKSLAYTKDTDYAEIFASTGQAINVSCFAKWDAKTGTYVEDNRQGANWEKTKSLRKQYRNVGAVMVATNDAMVEWALKQDWVDVVIPYHIVKTGTTIANEYQWNNYTSESADKIGNKTANIYPTEHNNDFATYTNLLNERGITPRFSRWYGMVASGELTESQYMKLVNEVRLPASELSAVVPSFNLDAAKKSFGIDNEGNVIEGGFVDKGGYMGGWYRQGVDVNQEVMAVAEDIKAGKSSLDVDYGMSKTAKEKAEARYKKQAKKLMTEEEKKAGVEIADFIESVSKMLDQSKVSKRKLRLGSISAAHRKVVEELMKTIAPSFSAEGYELWIDGTGAEHIDVRHGENGEADETMASREDKELIPWATNSPDGGEFIRDNSGKLRLSERFFNADGSKAPQIRVHKKVDEGTIYVSECVPDSKNKRIYITSAYKKGSTNQLLNIDSSESPQLTSETSFDSSATKHILHQDNSKVKKQLKRDSYAPTFYSKMERVIDDIKINKMGAGGVVSYLTGKGVKKEEIKWSGIETFLEGKKSLTKEELQEFVKGSQLQIEEQMGSEDEDETHWEEYKLNGGSNYREIVFTMPNSSYSNQMMKVHWGEDAEGVLVHARIQDFDVNGKKMLFVEEIQSDWHNEGHKRGYVDTTAELVKKTTVKTEYGFHRLYLGDKDLEVSTYDSMLKNLYPDVVTNEDIHRHLVEEYRREIKFKGSAPDAPFRDNYHEYVLKRLVRMAAEEGYDSIGWTPSEIQVERWSDEFAEGYRIEYDQDIPKFLKKYGKQWGATVGTTTLNNESNKANYVGNDGKSYKTIREWYESVMDDYANKDSSIWNDYIMGQTKVIQDGNTMQIQLKRTGKLLDETLTVSYAPDTVWSMDITDTMKNSVLYEGQPKFQKKRPSNRELLSNALESIIDTSTQAGQNEMSVLKEYKANIDKINELESHLAEVKTEIYKLSFSKGAKDTTRLKELNEDKVKTSNRINIYDKKLLRVEATKPMKDILAREKDKVRKAEQQKGREALQKLKEKDAETLREVMNRNQESRKKNIESRHRTELRGKIKTIVKDLNNLLLNPSKDKHIPIGLQIPVAEALDIINMDTIDADARIAEIDRLIAKEKNIDKIEKLVKTRSNISEQGENLKERLKALENAYAKIRESNDPLMSNSYDESIANLINATVEKVGNTALRNMTLEQLESVYDMFKAIRGRVRTANKMFKEEKKATVSANSEAVKTEVYEVGGQKTRTVKVLKFVKKFGWNSLKPIYAMRMIGSDTLTELYNNVRKGEDTWALDIADAKEVFKTYANQYNYWDWDMKKQYDFRDVNGKKFSLSLEQMMSLYAYSKRNQADMHLEKGGFVFGDSIEVVEKKRGVPIKYEVNDANPYQLSKDVIEEITSTLENVQKGAISFVDEMQKYLSETMGEKGNEVSLSLYDIKLFKETHYFPLKTSRYFREFNPEKSGTPKVKNKGFTKNTIPQAGNPIVLENFMDVWTNHVNEMSMYHAFTLPLEDFMRVYNYSSVAGGYDSVQQYIKNAYNTPACKYIETLMDDLNGGTLTDPTADIVSKGIGLFKKAAVFASASVVIQQPSAIARATALIDPKYFATLPKITREKHDAEWSEVKKYAPVAIIKEMGYFDTHMGKSTSDYITSREYDGIVDKTIAMFTDSNYRDDVFSKAPAVADELSWCYIWNAVKNEIASTSKLTGEALLQKAGERFTEVVTLTQVYDSVLSRSAFMRSKDTGVKMLSAFMAEPTTAMNMVADGIVQGKRKGSSQFWKPFGAVSASIVFNAILVSLVYAMRDDDEDETYAEKYVESLTAELLDGFNPLTYLFVIKDVWSIMQGYDVERSDMAIVSDLWESVENWFSSTKSPLEKISGTAGAVASSFGLPFKNIIRDVKGVINTFANTTPIAKTTWSGVGYSLTNAVRNSVPLLDRFWKEDTKHTKLYKAVISGNKTQIERMENQFEDEKSMNNALIKAIRENNADVVDVVSDYINGDVSAYDSMVKKLVAQGFSEEVASKAIKSVKSMVESAAQYEANGDTDAYNEKVADLVALGYDKDQLLEDIDMLEKSPQEDKATSIYIKDDYITTVLSGDTTLASTIKEDLINTMMENGKTEEEAEDSLSNALNTRYKTEYAEGRMSDSEVTAWVRERSDPKDTDDDIHWAVKEWKARAEHMGEEDYSYSKYGEFHQAILDGDTRTMNAFIKECRDYSNGKTNKEVASAIASAITSKFKPIYREASPAERVSLKAKLLNAYAQLGYARSKRSKLIDEWLED